MSISKVDFKAAFSVSDSVADWLTTALGEADAALDSLHRTVDGWKGEQGDGWAAFEKTRADLRGKIEPLRSTTDPAAALLALAPLKTAALRADAEALDGRRSALSERMAKSGELEDHAAKRLDALDAFSEADAIAPERTALRERMAEARARVGRCELDLADQLFAEISTDAMAAARIMVACRKARTEQWSCVVSNLLSVRARGAGAIFPAELENYTKRADRIQELIAQRSYDLAIDLCVRFALDIQQLDHMLERHRSCTSSVADLTARLGMLKPEPPGIRDALTEAAALAEERDYDGSVTRLADLTRRIIAAEAHQARLTDLSADLSTHAERITVLEGSPRAEALSEVCSGLSGQRATIETLLSGFDADAAESAIGRLSADLDAAETLTKRSEKLAGKITACLEDPEAADRLQGALRSLRAREHSTTIALQLQSITDALRDGKLDEVGEGIVAASLLLDRHVAFQKSCARAAEAVKSLSGTDGLSESIATMEELLTTARQCAEAHLYPDAEVMLSEVYVASRSAEILARQLRNYRGALDDADLTFEPLWTHTSADRLSKELKALQTNYSRAQTLGGAGKYAEATALLDRLIAQGDVLAVKLDMLESKLSRASLRTLLQHSEGPGLLDGLVSELGETLPEKAMAVVLKMRFSMDIAVESDDSGASLSLKHIYTMLSRVPESHVKGNTNLSRIELHTGAEGESTYNYGEDSMTLRCGRAGESRPVPLLEGDEAKAVEEDCLPQPGVAPSYFDWATLHEVGHAVDHKLGFMRGRQGDDGFGGWIEHGADVGEIARAAASALSFDADYILQCLQGCTPTAAPCPDEVEAGAWEKRRKEADGWCAAVSDRLWDDPATSRACALDGRVYQQAYPGLWVSYPLSARSAALSAYQFRSPIEWFAELYAGYHSGLLKESHPAVSWMKGL